MSTPARTLLALVLTVFIAFAVINYFGSASAFGRVKVREVTLNELNDLMSRSELEKASVNDSAVTAESVSGERIILRGLEQEPDLRSRLIDRLVENHVQVTLEKPPMSSNVLALLSVIAFPVMILALIYFLVLRPVQANRGPLASAEMQAAAEYEGMSRELREVKAMLEELRRERDSESERK
jgi:ATP-dependent Zn protease